MIPRFAACQEFGELCLKHAEFVVPWVSHHPEVEAAFLLMIPLHSAESFQTFNFGFDIVGL